VLGKRSDNIQRTEESDYCLSCYPYKFIKHTSSERLQIKRSSGSSSSENGDGWERIIHQII